MYSSNPTMKVEAEQLVPYMGSYPRINPKFLFRPPKPNPRFTKAAISIGAWLVMSVVIYYTYAPIYSHVMASTKEQSTEPLIRRKIWQIYLSPPKEDREKFQIKTESLSDTTSWIARNPDYEYNLVGDKGAEKFLQKYHKDDEALLNIFHGLKNTGMKSDLLRYLILSAEGGIYADTDVEALKSVDKWVPKQYLNTTRAIVGVEFDRLDGVNWLEVHDDLQFCQWTIAAAPGHPLLSTMANKVVSGLKNYTDEHNATFSNIIVPPEDVLKLTGPGAWTDAVFEQLQEYEPSLVSVRNFTRLRHPWLIGDILVLPIDGFGLGQPHSNSTNDGTIPDGAFVKHHFRGSWRWDGSMDQPVPTSTPTSTPEPELDINGTSTREEW